MKSKTLNIGMNRGKARLWIEGNWLAQAGFARGMAYTVEAFPDNGVISIKATPDGSRKVAGTTSRPIMDLTKAGDMAAIGGAGSVVLLECRAPGWIVVSET
jgi:DNA (cytosine-5)-methyltransferase 1